MTRNVAAVDLFAGADPGSAWAAGIIEGEGYIGYSTGRMRQDGTPSLNFRVRVVMSDSDIIDRIHALFGRGRGGTHPYSNKYGFGKKQLYLWEVRRAEDVRFVLAAIVPFLGERRLAQTKRLLERMDGYIFTDASERVRRSWRTRRKG